MEFFEYIFGHGWDNFTLGRLIISLCVVIVGWILRYFGKKLKEFESMKSDIAILRDREHGLACITERVIRLESDQTNTNDRTKRIEDIIEDRLYDSIHKKNKK
jgi:hypothetical protein